MSAETKWVEGKMALQRLLGRLLEWGEEAGLSREDIVDDFCDEISDATNITVARE